MTPDEIEAARTARGLSIRAAARKAGISEGRWRQIVVGAIRVGGMDVPVNPKPSTLEAMARAVSEEPRSTGATIREYSDDELLAEVRRRVMRGGSDAQAKPEQKMSGGDPAAPTVDPVHTSESVVELPRAARRRTTPPTPAPDLDAQAHAGEENQDLT